jgi:uncharacterized damage-inducible protein DinB
MAMEREFCAVFKESCCFRISESHRMLSIALSKLPEGAVWERPNANSNSIGNQLLHMEGNLRQYIIATLGGEKDRRTRDQEFNAEGGVAFKTLWENLEATIHEAKATLEDCKEERFLSTHSVQSFQLSGVDVAVHAVEHLSYHTGQVAFWIKQLTDQALGFYNEEDLTNTTS